MIQDKSNKSKSHKFQEIGKKGQDVFHELLSLQCGIRTLSVSEEATMIIDQFLSDSEIADILLSFQERLSSNQNNTNDTTDDSDESEEVEEGIVLASV